MMMNDGCNALYISWSMRVQMIVIEQTLNGLGLWVEVHSIPVCAGGVRYDSHVRIRSYNYAYGLCGSGWLDYHHIDSGDRSACFVTHGCCVVYG